MDLEVKIEEPEVEDVKLRSCCGAPIFFLNDKCEECARNITKENVLPQNSDNNIFFDNNQQLLYKNPLGKHFILNMSNDIQSINCKPTEKPFQCCICEKGLSSKYYLKRHLWTHTGEKPFQCNICEKSFSFKSELKRHEKIHTEGKPFHCNVCKKRFLIKRRLKIHEKIHTRKRVYQCNICDKGFSLLYELKWHQMTHTRVKSFQCCTCERSFRLKYYLKLHEKTHTEENKFQCCMCSRCFSAESDLKLHEETHTEEKEYKCNLCGKAFIRKQFLRFHITLAHTNLNNENCECQICINSTEMKLREPSEFEGVSVFNSSLKPQPYECQICSTLFNEKCTLIKHLSLHKTLKRKCGKSKKRKKQIEKKNPENVTKSIT